MKIVVLGLRGFPNIQGGVETHCEHLFSRMVVRGHDVTVLGRKPYMRAAPTEYKGVRLVPLPCPKHKSLEAILHTLLGVFIARRLNPDILHIHAVGPSLLVPLARLMGMRVVTTNHGPDYERAKWNGAARVVLRLGEWLGSRFSNAVVAISEPIAQHLRSVYDCAPEVIPNGVVIRGPAQRTDALERFGLGKGRYILAVGRLVPEKGLHDLVEAFARADLPGWKLVIAGRADHEDAYSLSLKARAAAICGIVMPGFVTGEPLAQLYSHAGLFVIPSYHEGLPFVLLEALSYGLPVAASDISANRQCGLPENRFFPPGDINKMAGAMALLSQKALTPDERQRQIDLTSKNFDWDRIADRTVELYRRVLDGDAVHA